MERVDQSTNAIESSKKIILPREIHAWENQRFFIAIGNRMDENLLDLPILPRKTPVTAEPDGEQEPATVFTTLTHMTGSEIGYLKMLGIADLPVLDEKPSFKQLAEISAITGTLLAGVNPADHDDVLFNGKIYTPEDLFIHAIKHGEEHRWTIIHLLNWMGYKEFPAMNTYAYKKNLEEQAGKQN